MKKVLIITDLEHATPRFIGLIKHLPKYNWEAIIITPQLTSKFTKRYGNIKDIYPKEIQIIETKNKNIIQKLRNIFIKTYLKYSKNKKNKTIQDINEINIYQKIDKAPFIKEILFKTYKILINIFNYPDAHTGWKKFALQKANQILKTKKVKAIISSSSPVTSHIIASKLCKKWDIPWLADFRDLWSQNHAYPYGKIRKRFEKKLEIKTIKVAQALTTVSTPLVNKLKKIHQKNKVYVITNGFDLDYKKQEKREKLNSQFTITYTGQIYDDKQDISNIIISLSNLINQKKIKTEDILFRVFGPSNQKLFNLIKKHQLEKNFYYGGSISWKKIQNIQKESQLLLLLNWEDQAQPGIYTTKFFEYLAVRRPIIATGGYGNDVIEKSLSITQAGVYLKDIKSIEKYLINFYNSYQKNGKVPYNGINSEIEKFNFINLSKKFTNILNQICYDT